MSDASDPDLLRIKYGAGLIIAAFVLLFIVLGLALWRFTAAADVTAVVGIVASVVGTIIGTFFGVQAGSTGKEATEARRADAERVARIAMGKLQPRDAEDVMRQLQRNDVTPDAASSERARHHSE